MKMIKIILAILISLNLLNCRSSVPVERSDFNYYVTKNDSILIEEILLDNKNVIFSKLYDQAKSKTYKSKGMEIKDTLTDMSYQRFSHYDWHISNDYNQEKLLEKWLNKPGYDIDKTRIIPQEDGTLDIARALDFYNSFDLASYLDSLRGKYYKETVEIKYKSKIPKEATVRYTPIKK